MDPLTGPQIQVMERVRERLLNQGFTLTDAELVSYAVVYRRMRSDWNDGDGGMNGKRKPHPLKVLVLFGLEEEGYGE
jgi:hypothetical protein